MRFTAPVGIVASLHDEGVLYPDGWPRRSDHGEGAEGTEVAITLAGTVADRVDVVPLPRITDVVAEAVEGWWGSHGWSYPGRQLILHVDRVGQPINGWPITRLSAALEQNCAELRTASWTRTDGTAPEDAGLTWTAGNVEIAFMPGEPVRVSYLSPAPATDRPTRVARARDEAVLLIDERHDPENVLVWLRYPTDVGTTPNELLAGTSPAGTLPRCLLVPRSRLAR